MLELDEAGILVKNIESSYHLITAMDLVNYRIFLENELPPILKLEIESLSTKCFENIERSELDECFYAEIFAHVCGFFKKELVGHLILHKRRIYFDGKQILISGAVGACVKKSMRKKGIAEKLMKNGLAKLKQEGCDVACLTVDPENGTSAIHLYEKLGFSRFNRKISFEDSNGKIRYDTDTMFLPLCSSHFYEFIVENHTTFHYGKGYW